MVEPQIPGYTIEKRLGRGGMATVYLAVQQPINRKVALKVMSNQLGEDSVWAKRFIQEAQVIAQLTHPNVVPVYDVGTHDGSFYISMEHLIGGSLKDRMKQGIAVWEALKIIIGVAAGLDFAGEKGFVHRDIKPDNIMFRSDGSPVILDFGIVKQMSDGPSQMTQTGVIVGTTSYMSPEQAQGRELDQRSDIYALGIMFYELLTGRPPFKGETDVGTLLMHINEPVPRLTEPLNVFQPIIDKALAKDPFHRYNRAREMIDHIQQLEPVIKTALAKIKVGKASDPTMVKAVAKSRLQNDDDATMVMGREEEVTDAGRHTGSITTEEELTQVLSSARATIRDFSAESRTRKARRTRTIITTISCVAVIAMSYVGYQQLYIAPQERAAAEAKLREVELKSQRKVDELLAEAQAASAGLLPSETARVDNMIAIYRQVLKLDPENSEAAFVLEKFGDRYIEMAKNSVRRQDLALAETYRDYVEQLIPNSPELPGLRHAIKSLRGEQLDQQLVQEELSTLLALAKDDIESSPGFSDNAYTKLQQVLRMDPSNTQANALFKTMLEKLYTQAEAEINANRIASARQNITLLERYYGDPVKVATLDAKLNTASASLAKKQSVLNLTKQAERLRRERRTVAINDELRETYLAILENDSNHAGARDGLNNTCKFDAKLARQALAERDYVRADNQLSIIKRTAPRFDEIAQLESEITLARKNMQSADALLSEAHRLVGTTKTGEEKRQELFTANEKIAKARQLDAGNPKLAAAVDALENVYLETIRELLAEENSTLAEGYFEDAASTTWPSDRILQLQLAQQKTSKKPKRVITGGF